MQQHETFAGPNQSGFNRRGFLTRLASGLLIASAAGGAAFAEELVRTPWQTEGPFYPRELPLDRDNDLIIVNKAITPAVGEVTHLSGRILDARGNPFKGAVIEIWQVDHNGVYLHGGSDNSSGRDKNFQGFGRFETASTGAYRFRTIKPVPYPGRTPHIHVKVKKGGSELLTTQVYVRGEPQNTRDGVLRSIRDPKARESVVVNFAPIPGSKIGELAAKFDIVLGLTPPAGRPAPAAPLTAVPSCSKKGYSRETAHSRGLASVRGAADHRDLHALGGKPLFPPRSGRPHDPDRRERFRPIGGSRGEDPPRFDGTGGAEAPTGFDNRTNPGGDGPPPPGAGGPF